MMISVIICSRSEQMLSQVKVDVAATIGVSHEIIAIDNSTGKYGICEAYNIGARQSQYDVLCFMHEDINFHTPSWGSIITGLLDNPEVGVVGVAGGTYQPKAPAGWGGVGRSYIGINVIHTTATKTQHDYYNPTATGKKLVKAATLDGLWLCCRKSVWEEFKFDSVAFPGFHFYDVDFCTRVATKYSNYITFDVLIEHFSHGTFDKVWMQNAIGFYKKRKKYLPIDSGKLTRTEKGFLDLLALQEFTLQILHHGLPKEDVLFCVLECLKLSPLNRDNIYLFRRYLAMK